MYANDNPLRFIDPLGLCPCSSGHWSEEVGDFGFAMAFGGYFGFNKAVFHCTSDPSLTVDAKQTTIGGGAIALIGVSWSVSGDVYGVYDSSGLAGWSQHQIFGSLGPVTVQANGNGDPGGSGGLGPGLGGGIGYGSTYTQILKDTCKKDCCTDCKK